MASICRKSPSTLAQQSIYRIHPAIGVARVGNLLSDFFIGPELPGKGNTGADGGQGSAVPPYKDGSGRVKRQAARFRAWKYVWVAKKSQYVPKEEINLSSPNIKTIKWTVELANRKASFYQFNGTNGETSPYGPGGGFVKASRNAGVTGAARDTLEIVPGEKSIEGAMASGVEFRKSTPGIPIDYLGELRTDDKGRLLVLGGRGDTKFNTPTTPPVPTYANNDHWFDDVSDGPVRAEIEFNTPTGPQKVPSEQIVDAWVLVGPPDFAPDIGNLVSLWDTLSDVAVQFIPISPQDGRFDEYAPGKGLKRLKLMKADFAKPGGFTTYKVSFRQEIYPIVQRVLNYSYVHKNAVGRHTSFPWDQMAEPLSPANKPTKDTFFGWIRPTLGMTRPSDPSLLSTPYMPKLLGDEAEEDPSRGIAATDPRTFLMLTALQYAQLIHWWKGNFEKDGWPADNKPASLPAPPSDVRPEGLDRAAAESCVGGAFYPGIEVSWLIRNPKVYGDFWGPFRIDPWDRDPTTGKINLDGSGTPKAKEIAYGTDTIKLRAGFFSQQMALPWQADFMDCAIETHDAGLGPMEFGWWPAQRPDYVMVKTPAIPPAAAQLAWDRGFTMSPNTPRHLDMINNWSTRGFVEPDGPNYVEKEGPTPPPPPPPVTPPVAPPSGGDCFIATAAYGSQLAPEVQFLQQIRDGVLRGMDWGRRFFETYWKYYYRISPAIAEEIKRDPELQKTIRWSIVEPWTYYMRLLLSRPDWDRVNLDGLDGPLREFLVQLRKDMDTWLSAIELPTGFAHVDPFEAVKELNVILNFVLRTGGLEYLDGLVERGELPLRYEPQQEPALLDLLRGGGRTQEEIARILY